jgi:pyruvate/2-oxoglutarate dehydrogenase complex dihydrolipoamide acyltransferase (E2) component
VESSFSTSEALVRPWRTAAFVATTVATLELLILVGFVVALFGQPVLDWVQGSTSPTARTAKKEVHVAAKDVATPPPAPAAPELARRETSVLVLNGNGVAGAAHSAGQLVRRKGYTIAGVENASRSDYRRTVVMYRPGYAPEAARFAHDLHVKLVSPLDGLRLRDLMGAHVAIVLGAS